jgi:hypothetical protein
MAKYEIENLDFENLSSAEADKAIEKTRADIFEDNKHPYMDSTHPQNKAFVEYMTNLYKASTRKEGEPFDLAAEKAAQEEADMAELQQNRLVADGEAEMDRLAELGFSRDKIPFDIQQWQVEALRMQRLNNEGNLRELSPMLETALKNLGLFDELNLFHNLVQNASIDPKSRAQHIELILGRMYQANKQKYGGIE